MRLEAGGFGGNAHDLDFDPADGVDSEVLAINVAHFLRQVALDGVELGVGADTEVDNRLKFALSACNGGAGRSDAFELFAAGFHEAMQGVAGDFEAAFVAIGNDQGPRLAHEDEQGNQGQHAPEQDGLERGEVQEIGPDGHCGRGDGVNQSVAGASGQRSSLLSWFGVRSLGRRTPSMMTSTLETFLPVMAMTCLRTEICTS